jgi:large subunit ribosomal protein L11
MAKEIVAKIKLQCPGGQATPAPPVGPALGQHQVNIGEFVKRFNDATKDQPGMIIPVEITVYKDRKFDMVFKSPPASVLIKKLASLAKGSTNPKREMVGSIKRDQIEEIVKIKRKDLNAFSDKAALRIIEGTARSMGVEVVD